MGGLSEFFNAPRRMTRWLAGTTAAFTLASTLGFFGPSPAAAQEAITVGQCYSFPQMERLLRVHGQQEFMEGYKYNKGQDRTFARTDFTFNPRTATGYQIVYSDSQTRSGYSERCVEREMTAMRLNPSLESALLHVGSQEIANEAAAKVKADRWGWHDKAIQGAQNNHMVLEFIGQDSGHMVTFFTNPGDADGLGPIGGLALTKTTGKYAGFQMPDGDFFRVKRQDKGTSPPRVSIGGVAKPPYPEKK